MEQNSKKNTSEKIERADQELYSRSREQQTIPRHEFHSTHEESVPTNWQTQQETMKTKPKKKHLLYSKNFRMIFLAAGLFFVASIVFAMVSFFKGSATVSNNNIDIVILGNSFVDGGELLPLQVKVANRNKTSIEIADLLVEYSKGASGSGDIVRERVSLGEIRSGDIAEEIVSVSLFGEQGTVRDISFTLEYRVSKSNAIFVKHHSYQVTIATSPVDVAVSGPSDVVSNQVFTTEVVVSQNSTEVSKAMMVRAIYPSGFKFESANPKPTFGNDTWLLGDLAPSAEKKISIQGSLKVSSGEERIITIVSGSQNPNDEQQIGVQFTSTPLQITVGQPFVSIGIFDAGKEVNEFAIASGEKTSFDIGWQNELSTNINNLEVSLKFSGNGFDPNRVSVNQGFFNSSQNTIVWNAGNNSEFSSVSSGQTGNLSFSLEPKAGVSNGTIQMTVDVSGVPAGQSLAKETIKNIYTGTIKTIPEISLLGKALQSTGPLVNTGSMPPQVGQETTYTIEWSVGSASNNLKDAQIKASLPSYVSWKNQIHPTSEDIVYNNITQEVTWNIGTINASPSNPKKAYFKVGFTPTSGQIGSNPSLVGQSKLTAYDTFSGSSITKTLEQISSALSGEAGIINDNVIE